MTWEMIGHEWAVRLLKRHIEMGQVRHAYLISGQERVGKTTLALRFAQALNCEAPPSPGERCDACRSCLSIAKRQHPDLHVVEAAQEGETLAVDQVRELQRQIALSAYMSPWRIALLLRFQEASISAANALLKTLEEPPPHVVMLLTANDEDNLPPTVVSRCERLHLRQPSLERVAAGLVSKGTSPQLAQSLAALAGGRPGLALEFAEDEGALRVHADRQEYLLEVLAEPARSRLDQVEGFLHKLRDPRDPSRQRREARALLEAWLPLWRAGMLANAGLEESLALTGPAGDPSRFTRKLRGDQSASALRSIMATLQALDQNAQLGLALGNLMLDLPALEREA